MKDLTPKERRLRNLGMIDSDGELTSYGELVAEERHFGTKWGDEYAPDYPGGPDSDPDYWGVK